MMNWVMRVKAEILTTEHSNSIYHILNNSFSSPWSIDTINTLFMSDNAVCLGVFEGGILAGYAALEWVLDEGSLSDIAVLPEQRQKGIANVLMEALLSEAQARDIQFVTLEVRESNTPAINLYKKFGFRTVGKRPRYYKAPVEDALLMTKDL